VALCDGLLRRPELGAAPAFRHNTDRVANRPDLERLIADTVGSMTADDVTKVLERIGIANARMRSAAELLTHPQMVARNRWHDIETPGGPVRAMLPPVSFAAEEPVLGSVPRLGQHNVQIRRELAAGRPPRDGSV
jgi:crotonobetainyl-CoA:carnitine CoA-transferase CaiB-like acyl-CoA transferase